MSEALTAEVEAIPEWKLTLLAVLWTTLVKYAVGLWDYSGHNSPMMYGDCEAQRHWMEITVHLPLHQWYRYDLQYWGLDYPPLTAYVSYVFGRISRHILPQLVAFEASRGIESPDTKMFMRLSVLISELIAYVPAVLFACRLMGRRIKQKNSLSTLVYVTSVLLNPALVIIDHGHFQYNAVTIGLTLAGACLILGDSDVLGSVCFCLALNFKQMSLYYAPVFFCVLLRKCLCKPTWAQGSLHLLRVGSTVIATFAALWAPFCVYPGPLETCASSSLLVLQRLFPFSRGIFEDKVANFWYVLSVMFDFRDVFSVAQMASMSLLLTLLLLAPIAFDLLRRPACAVRLLLALANSALVFFLCSFQVHEKSLLLALAPAALLLPLEPLLVAWLQVLGAFTIFPLLRRDGLVVVYCALLAAHASLAAVHQLATVALRRYSFAPASVPVAEDEKPVEEVEPSCLFIPRYLRELVVASSITGMALLHVLEACVEPPPRYPDLFPALFSIFGAANLVCAWLILLYWQLSLDLVPAGDAESPTKESITRSAVRQLTGTHTKLKES